MLLKWIGAALVVTACGGCGFVMAQNYKKEERYLRSLMRALDTMISELSYRRTPLPQLLITAAEHADGELKNLLKNLARELERQITPDVGCCMEVVLGGYPSLPKLSAQVLHMLGRSLGQFDLSGQLRELDAVKSECARLLEIHSQDRENRVRNYQTLGLCAGAALAILFI